jgi:hypothetical protein
MRRTIIRFDSPGVHVRSRPRSQPGRPSGRCCSCQGPRCLERISQRGRVRHPERVGGSTHTARPPRVETARLSRWNPVETGWRQSGAVCSRFGTGFHLLSRSASPARTAQPGRAATGGSSTELDTLPYALARLVQGGRAYVFRCGLPPYRKLRCQEVGRAGAVAPHIPAG